MSVMFLGELRVTELMHGADFGRNPTCAHHSVNLAESPVVTAGFSRAFLGVCSSDGLSA